MELTLTGASLTSSTTANNNHHHNKNNDPNAAAAATPSSNTHSHSHSHSHHHHHPHPHECPHHHKNNNKISTTSTASHPTKKECCNDPHSSACAASSSSQQPSKYQPVQSIPKEKLTSNPSLLFQALVQSIKVGNYDTFLYLCTVVTDFERVLKEKEQVKDQDVRFTHDSNTVMKWGQDKEEELLKERGHGVVKQEDLTSHCTTALAKRTEEGHSLAHWAAKQGTFGAGRTNGLVSSFLFPTFCTPMDSHIFAFLHSCMFVPHTRF